jgi:hypothetical protein
MGASYAVGRCVIYVVEVVVDDIQKHNRTNIWCTTFISRTSKSDDVLHTCNYHIWKNNLLYITNSLPQKYLLIWRVSVNSQLWVSRQWLHQWAVTHSSWTSNSVIYVASIKWCTRSTWRTINVGGGYRTSIPYSHNVCSSACFISFPIGPWKSLRTGHRYINEEVKIKETDSRKGRRKDTRTLHTARFEVLMAMNIRSTVFCDAIPCSLVGTHVSEQ